MESIRCWNTPGNWEDLSFEPQHPIEAFVRKVRFFLHPSYRPDDVVDVKQPPFQIVRRGWGEFPIRVQLFFQDEKNKPVNIVHILKLTISRTGKYVFGAEKPLDIELDRLDNQKEEYEEELNDSSTIQQSMVAEESLSNLIPTFFKGFIIKIQLNIKISMKYLLWQKKDRQRHW